MMFHHTGQCDDTYSAMQLAVELSKAFDVGVNELPMSIVLSRFEQKAVAIVPTILALDIKNVSVGPTFPSFVSPKVWKMIQDNYSWKAIRDPEIDLRAMMIGK